MTPIFLQPIAPHSSLATLRSNVNFLDQSSPKPVTTTLSWTGTRCHEDGDDEQVGRQDGDFIDDAEADLEGDATMASNDQSASNEDYSVVRGLFIRKYQAQLIARFQCRKLSSESVQRDGICRCIAFQEFGSKVFRPRSVLRKTTVGHFMENIPPDLFLTIAWQTILGGSIATNSLRS